MASKRIPIIPIFKDDNEEDPPKASKQERISEERPRASLLEKGILPPTSCSAEHPRASEQEGTSKANEDLQKDPPTSCRAPSLVPDLIYDISAFESTKHSCSHREPLPRICMVCGQDFPVVCRAPPECMELGW